MAIMSAMDYTPVNAYLKIFVCGEFGTGKSRFGSTFPTKGHVFNFDRKIISYAGKDFSYTEYPLSAAGWIEFEKDFKEVEKMVNDGLLRSVIIDSTTTMQDVAMERALSMDPKRSVTDGPLWNVHYQIVKNLMAPKIRAFVSLKCNILLVSHLQIITDQESGSIVSIKPLMVGQLADIVPGYFEEVYCAFTRTVPSKDGGPPNAQYYLRTAPLGHYKARSCLAGDDKKIPMEIPNNYNNLMDLYQKGVLRVSQTTPVTITNSTPK